MNRLLTASLLFLGCAPALRTLPSGPPAREALSSAGAARTVLGVNVWLFDSAPGDRSKPVLLCLHAIGHGSGDFTPLVVPGWRVIAIDWPGHGRSAQDTQPASATRYAEFLTALIDDLKLERPVILGNSIGGAAAIRYAAAHPEKVRALVLANPGGLDSGASGLLGRFFIGNLVSHFEQGVRNEARFADWFAAYYADIVRTEAGRARRDQIVAAGYDSAQPLVDAWTSFMQADAYIAPLLPKLTMPTLVAWADKDGLVSWSRNREAIATIPNATVVHFAESGHAAFIDEPGRFQASLIAFIASLEKLRVP
ncbi:MAG: alpha/beta hydrolase [Myxococcaceae bacterium]